MTVAWIQHCGEKPMFRLQSQWSPETHLLPLRSAWDTSARKLSWEIVWRNAPRIWRDFVSALPFKKTSHSNKAGSTTVKRARLTGKGSRSTAVLLQ
jgi:hypothetical protein